MRTLVAVASKHGATADIAEAIAERLRDHGHEVTVSPADLVTGVDAFDAVVLGSAVYAGHWRGEATAMVDRFVAELASRPVWLFSSGPVGDPPKPVEDPVEVADLAATTGAIEHRVFPGAIDRHALGFGERAIVRALKVPEGDFRDPDAVRAWTDEIAATLGTSEPVA